MVAPGIVAGIGSALGGLFGAFGQSRANKAQIQVAREQMDFQEKMSNTAYRRAMNDMRKAGLNPILAGRLGGASSPAGAMPNIGNELAPLGQGLSNATSAYMTAQQMAAQNQAIKAQTAQTRAQTANINEQTRISRRRAEQADAIGPFWDVINDITAQVAPWLKQMVAEQTGNSAVTTQYPDRNAEPSTQPNSSKNVIEKRLKEDLARKLEAQKRYNKNVEKWRPDNSQKIRSFIYDMIHGKRR